MRKKGMSLSISNNKSIKVSSDKIKIECVYGKKVKKSYVISLTYDEWRLTNQKVKECCEYLELKEK